jgi:hypothetical protein
MTTAGSWAFAKLTDLVDASVVRHESAPSER